MVLGYYQIIFSARPWASVLLFSEPRVVGEKVKSCKLPLKRKSLERREESGLTWKDFSFARAPPSFLARACNLPWLKRKKRDWSQSTFQCRKFALFRFNCWYPVHIKVLHGLRGTVTQAVCSKSPFRGGVEWSGDLTIKTQIARSLPFSVGNLLLSILTVNILFLFTPHIVSGVWLTTKNSPC